MPRTSLLIRPEMRKKKTRAPCSTAPVRGTVTKAYSGKPRLDHQLQNRRNFPQTRLGTFLLRHSRLTKKAGGHQLTWSGRTYRSVAGSTLCCGRYHPKKALELVGAWFSVSHKITLELHLASFTPKEITSAVSVRTQRLYTYTAIPRDARDFQDGT